MKKNLLKIAFLLFGIFLLSGNLIKALSFKNVTVETVPKKENGTLIIQSYDKNIKYYISTIDGKKIGMFRTGKDKKIKKHIPAGYYRVKREDAIDYDCTMIPVCGMEKVYFLDTEEE